MGWIVLGLWLGCGYLAFGLYEGYFTRRFPRIQKDEYGRVWYGHLAGALSTGLCSLIAMLLCLRDFKKEDGFPKILHFGIKFTQKHEEGCDW